MHVGLHHERVTPPAQPPARLFSRDRVAALHHQSPHLHKQFRPHQRHVVDCLKLAASCRRSRCGPAEPAPSRDGSLEIVQAVGNRNPPCLRTPKTRIRHISIPGRPTPRWVPGRMCFSVAEQLLLFLLVEVLQSLQHRRNVVPRLGVEPDLIHRDLTELKLTFLDLS